MVLIKRMVRAKLIQTNTILLDKGEGQFHEERQQDSGHTM